MFEFSSKRAIKMLHISLLRKLSNTKPSVATSSQCDPKHNKTDYSKNTIVLIERLKTYMSIIINLIGNYPGTGTDKDTSYRGCQNCHDNSKWPQKDSKACKRHTYCLQERTFTTYKIMKQTFPAFEKHVRAFTYGNKWYNWHINYDPKN